MAQSHAQTKYMTFGEGGTAAAFVLLAVFSIVIAAKAYTPEYAFHAYLFAAASAAAAFAIVNRFMDRSADPVPAEIDGKPNYNMGPVKFATIAAVIWGIAGFTVGLWIALELAYPALEVRIERGEHLRVETNSGHRDEQTPTRAARPDRLCLRVGEHLGEPSRIARHADFGRQHVAGS